jgi:hypothetical protein
MNADADAERSMSRAVAADDARRETHRGVGFRDAQEHGVADHLDLLGAVLVEEPANGRAEVGGRIRGVFVAVRFRQSSVTGEIREDEGVASGGRAADRAGGSFTLECAHAYAGVVVSAGAAARNALISPAM